MQDNGFVYLRVNNTQTLSPVGLEGEEAHWHWLNGKEVMRTNYLITIIHGFCSSTSYHSLLPIFQCPTY